MLTELAKWLSRPSDWFKTTPKEGQDTGKQDVGRGGGISDIATHITFGTGHPGAGTYRTYRKMRANPTIALARAISQAPILAADHVVVSDADDGQDDPVRVAVDDMLTRLWPFFIHNALFALDYGWQPWEKVWELRDGRLELIKLKPLLPDLTDIIVDEHGCFLGLKQKAVTLPPEKSLILTYDSEGGNLFGRSRNENVRGAWNNWNRLRTQQDKYNNNVSAIVPIIEYPEGTGRDRSGAKKDNFELAEKLLQSLGSGKGVAMPNTMALAAVDLARAGVNVDKLRAWHLDFLETKGTHGTAFVEQLRYDDSLMFRGWLVPERTATEGQHGTNAEAVTHAQIALVIADQFFNTILRHVNWFVVDPYVAFNFGEDRVGTVRVEAVALDRAQRAFFTDLVSKLLGAPQNIDIAMQMLELAEMAEAVGLPVRDDVDGLPVAEDGVTPVLDELLGRT